MSSPRMATGFLPIAAAMLVLGFACTVPRQERKVADRVRVASTGQGLPISTDAQPVRPVSHRQDPQPLPSGPRHAIEVDSIDLALSPATIETLADLEARALADNPTLRRLRQEASAEWAKTGYVSKLPDPTLSSMFFLPPMRFEPDRQVAEIQLTQVIPWLARLGAEKQQACLEALAARNEYEAERLRVIGDLRSAWFRLYVLNKQIEITDADEAQIERLIATANARVATGDAQPGDVLLASLELANLREQLLGYRQQVVSTAAELNRLAGRDARAPLVPPAEIDASLPDWNHDLLRDTALAWQPELNAARMRTAASRWGVEVARLKRRPDVSVSGGWVPMDSPLGTMPSDGDDSWTLGFSTSLPIWRDKYDAMQYEASRRHFAAHASEEETVLRLDAAIADLWGQARAAAETVELYETTILPQARQAYEADQQSLATGGVAFDRVIRDFRALLTLEVGYHRALGQVATVAARIRQTVGDDLAEVPQPGD